MPAASDPPSEARNFGWSVGTGIGMAMLSLGVGGGILALHDDSHLGKHAGAHIIAFGVALSPLVSHLIAHEWKRGLAFSALPIALAITSAALLESFSDDLLDNGAPPPRVAYGTCLAVEVLAASVGIIDSLMARQRHHRRPNNLALLPSVNRNQFGLILGGSL
jgi:hypothetical protein